MLVEFEEKTQSSNVIYQGRIINLKLDEVMLPSGKKAKREIVEHPGAVGVVPISFEKKIVLVRQYRKPAGRVLLEIPAGKLEAGENPEVCAARELMEEISCRANKLNFLLSFYTTPGFCNEMIYLYLAEGLSFTDAKPDPDEIIEVVNIPLDEAVAKVFSGEIVDAKTIIGIFLAKQVMVYEKN
ncbi:MAG: NUDIX hydrolase [Bacillota bacterium]